MTETQSPDLTQAESNQQTAKSVTVATGRQGEIPFAVVEGTPVTELPQDLYIPPDALEVILEAFSGPLDLLLYLIRRQNLDILDIPIVDITRQYVAYIELMQEMRFSLAAEYLVMAAILAEIKSRMLLPRPVSEDEDEEDPRAELVRRLQQYERFKQAAEDLDGLPRMERDTFAASAHVEDKGKVVVPPAVELGDILHALKSVMDRAELFTQHHVTLEPLSVRERMSSILRRLQGDSFTPFEALFTLEEGRRGVVVSLLAVLELLRGQMIEMVQNEPYQPIHVKAA